MDIRKLTKRFKATLTPNRDIYNRIVIVIALDSIHNNFDLKTSSFLKIGDKTINEIQQILCSAIAKNLSKQATNVISKLAMALERLVGQDSAQNKEQLATNNAIIITNLVILIEIATYPNDNSNINPIIRDHNSNYGSRRS